LEHEIAQLKGTDFKTVKNQHGEFTIHSEPLDEAFERVDSENQQLRAQLANAEQTIERLEAALAHLEARPVKSDVVEEAVNSLIVAIFRAAGPSGLTEAELADKLTALAADAAD
jgi:predicted RNase H-like nuclease (RuvC/YqgF family)